MSEAKIDKSLLLMLLLFFIAYFFLSLPYFSGDVKNHLVWGTSILKKGAFGFYQREFPGFSFPNYPPVSMFLFAASVWFYDFVYHWVMYFNLKFPIFPSFLIPFMQWENTQISFLKLPAIVPPVLIGLLIYFFSKNIFKDKKSYLWAVLFLINPAVIYLAVIWGQNDLLQNLFLLLAVYLLFKEKLWPSFFIAGLSILSKQTILMLWLTFFLIVFKKYGFLKSVQGVLTSLLVLFISYLPFHSFSLSWPFLFYKETLKTTGYLVSDNAINLWGLVYNFAPVDAGSFLLGLTLETWGYLLFAITAGLLALIYLKKKFTIIKSLELLFTAASLYFLVLTRMHERYLIPVVILSCVLVICKKRYLLNLIFFSALQFLNLYRGLYQPDIGWLKSLVFNVIFLDSLVLIYVGFTIYNIYQFLKND